MAGARLEDCAEWLRMASAQESNNHMAIWGSRRPTEKNVARQSSGHAGQKKNCGTAINGSRGPKEKIAARQWGNHAGLLKNSGAAIGVSHWPHEKLRRGNQGITPAS
jgi:hypothetical protein